MYICNMGLINVIMMYKKLNISIIGYNKPKRSNF